jgi:hypothetical protein
VASAAELRRRYALDIVDLSQQQKTPVATEQHRECQMRTRSLLTLKSSHPYPATGISDEADSAKNTEGVEDEDVLALPSATYGTL